jgi:ubiquinone/menaquinone biosynthesis C-methylase UbiE
VKPDYIYLNTLQVSAEHDPFAADRYRQFARVLPEAARRVLDVGCSTGDGGKALKAIRPELALVALDCLQRRLDLLPAGIYADAKCSYSTDMGFEAGTFDAVVAGEFVQNLSYGDVLTSLAEFRRVLRPGGMLLMTTPFPDYLKRRLEGRPASGGPHL